MRRVSPIVLLFAFSLSSTSLLADESRGAKPSVGELIKQLGDSNPDKVCAAARALAREGAAKDAAPALKGLLKHRNGRVKLAAAEALWRLEHRAAELVPVYIELLTAMEDDVRAAAAWRLGRLGSDARPAVPVLAAALRDESFEVRVQVGQALANLGPLAEPALPALVRALGDQQLDEAVDEKEGAKTVRKSPALPAVVEFADDAIPLLIKTFRESDSKRERDGDSRMRHWIMAARAAHAFPAFGGRAVAPLLAALESEDSETRRYAAVALREMAELRGLPQNAIEKLEKCLDDSDKGIRRLAADALSWARPSSTKAVTILAKRKEDGFRHDDKELLADLERMSPHNEAARKLLLQMLEDKEPETAQEAYRILGRLELPADVVLEAWIKTLSHADPKVRTQAIYALERMGPGAKSAKAALRERFKEETEYHCKAGILDALTAIDPNDPALVPLLINSLDDPDSWGVWRSLHCLESLGPRAKDASPRLEARLLNPKEKDEGNRNRLDDSEMRGVVDAILQIAPGSARTAASFLKALRHPGIRAVHDPKNTWYMRDRLEDGLHANLPAAAPLLREALKDEDADVRRSAALVLVRAELDIETAVPVLMDKLGTGTDRDDEQRRFLRRVVELLSRRQPSATPSVAAAWCKAWRTASPQVREILEPGLLVLQPESLPHLLDQLRKAKSPQARRDLAHLLARFEGQGKEVLPILREELREDRPASQYAAAQALMFLGPDAAEAVPDLAALLNHSHAGMRAVGAQSLGSVGRAAKSAVPALKAMLKDGKPELRMMAADALSRIDPDVSEPLAVLRDALIGDKNQALFRIRGDGIELPESLEDRSVYPDFLGEIIARYGERAVPLLAEVLDNADLDEWSADNLSAQCGSNARIQAALLLARIGPEAQKAVPALIRALGDRDPFIQDAAASALGRIGQAAKEAAPAVITLLERQNRLASVAGPWSSGSRSGGSSRAATRFGYGGPFDFRSLGRERILYQYDGLGYGFRNADPYGAIRSAYPYDAPYVLSRIDGEARSALPILRQMAGDRNHPGRLSAALAIWRSGGESPDLVPAFTAALEAQARNDAIIPLSRELRECLAELGTDLKPAVRVMVEWLKRHDAPAEDEDQAAVVEALGRIGTDARSAVDVLRPMLKGERWNARRRVAAALALFRILGEKDLALPVLREVLLGLEEHPSIYYWPDPTNTPRVHAMRALGVLAEKGDERAGALIVEAAKGDENPHVRVAALEVTARRKETNAAAVSTLCAVLRHPNASVRSAAASACGRLGALAKSSAKALRAATEDSDLAVRQAARQALEALD